MNTTTDIENTLEGINSRVNGRGTDQQTGKQQWKAPKLKRKRMNFLKNENSLRDILDNTVERNPEEEKVLCIGRNN